MRELTLLAPGKLEWRDVPPPRLESATDAIVRPIVATTCDLDAPMIRGAVPYPLPIALGHEFVAEVVEVGGEVRSVEVGCRVIVPFQIACAGCRRCRAGLTGSCESVPRLSMYGFGAAGRNCGGALSDLVRVPFADGMLVPAPKEVALEALASASDNLPDAFRTVGPPLRENPGADVLVVGGIGSIPLYAAGMAHALGAGRVDYLDTDPDRLRIAEALGAHAIEGPPPKRAGAYAITVDGSNDPAGLACALRSLEPNGVCTSLGIYFVETPVPLLDMYTRGVRFFTGRVNARAEIPHVLELVASGRFHPELVTSEVVPWHEAAEALARPTLKPVFVRAG